MQGGDNHGVYFPNLGIRTPTEEEIHRQTKRAEELEKIITEFELSEDLIKDDEEDEENTRSYERYIEEILKGTFRSFEIESIRLIGHGTRYASCGEVRPYGCVKEHADMNNAIYVKKVKCRCKRLGCSICIMENIKYSVGKIMDKITAALLINQEKNPNGRKPKISHWVVSPPGSMVEEFKTKAGMDKFRKLMRRELKKIGMTGWVEIFHPARFDRGLTKANWSPHIHCVGIGWMDREKVVTSHKKTGIMFKQIKNKRANSYLIESQQNLYALARYLMSHCGVIPGIDSVKYAGEFASKFSTEEVLMHEHEAEFVNIKDMAFKEGDSVNSDKTITMKIKKMESDNTGEIENMESIETTYDEFEEKIKNIVEKFKKESSIDYPAKAKTEIPSTQYYILIEKINSFLVIRISPAMGILCKICARRIKNLVPDSKTLESDEGEYNNHEEVLKECKKILKSIDDDEGYIICQGGPFREYNNEIDRYSGYMYFNEEYEYLVDTREPYKLDNVDYTDREYMAAKYERLLIKTKEEYTSQNQFRPDKEIVQGMQDEIITKLNGEFYPEVKNPIMRKYMTK